MIVKLRGRLSERKDNAVIIDVNGVFHEVLVPYSVSKRIEEQIDEDGFITLIVYHYFQLSPASGVPILVGFLNEVERDFFLQFIKVSGIGPRAAVKALNKSISEISKAIEEGDDKYLKTLPGIGGQKAKEVIAKLQGRIGKYGLIRDDNVGVSPAAARTDWHEAALEVLLQLQYKKGEAAEMINQALERDKNISSAEELLNEIYKQRINA